MDKVKVVIIGYGSMGQLYANLIASGKTPSLELYGICCRNEKRHEEIKKLFPSVRIFTSESEAISHHSAYHAVIITTPHKAHVAMAVHALSQGLHVLCEKPLGIGIHELGELEAVLHGSQLTFAMVFNWRAREVFRTVKQMISQGEIGQITHAVWIANFWYRTAYYHHLNPWRSSWSGEGGGLALNQMQHVFDIWNWLFGLPEDVYAQVDFGKFSDIKVDDSLDVIFSYQNGLRGVCVASSGESPGSNHFEIHGTLGKVVIENNSLTHYTNDIAADAFSRTATVTTGLPYQEKNYLFEQVEYAEYGKLLDDFGLAVISGGEPLATLSAGKNALAVANSIYLSAWSKKHIKMPIDEKEYEQLLNQRIACENNGIGGTAG